MRGRTYLVVILLSWALVLLWAGYWALENRRMEATARAYTQELIHQGAAVYAANCASCHGPLGEGVVGPRLNRPELQGDPTQDAETYDFIYKTVSQGRPGSVTPRWVRLPSGEWASFTQMPAWGQAYGGPLNEQALRAVTYFIMAGDWNAVNRLIPAAHLEGELPDVAGLPPELNARAKQLLQQKLCLTCHTIGSVGGVIGPDLSQVGSWGLDEEFLKGWIRNPLQTANRAPVWFSNHAGISPEGEPSGVRIEYGQPTMPVLPFTDEELDILVQYLMGLK